MTPPVSYLYRLGFSWSLSNSNRKVFELGGLSTEPDREPLDQISSFESFLELELSILNILFAEEGFNWKDYDVGFWEGFDS
jgi:hypothetical protein